MKEISRINYKRSDLLYEFPAETRLTVYRRLDIEQRSSCLESNTEPRWIGLNLDPRRFVILVDIFMFLVIFHIRSYWFVTFRCFILYWSWIFCEFQLSSSIKALFWTGPSLFQNVEKMMKFSNFYENLEIKTPELWNLCLRSFWWMEFR